MTDSNKSNNQKINIFWTGGLDSTCRIVELSQIPIVVQPHYLIDPLRTSTKYEIAAMDKIRALLQKDKRTKFLLLPLNIVDIRDIPENEIITRAYQNLHKRYGLGIQYDWLSRYAKHADVQIEVSLENSPRGRATITVSNECCLKLDHNNGMSVYRVDRTATSEDAILVFENLLLPQSIWNMTKKQEIAEMYQMGLSEITKHTWFCHHPIWGLTCGHCGPCQDAIHLGTGWRVSKVGWVLGGLRKIFEKICSRYSFIFSNQEG